ncbi:IPTL-CTERM sorting domain-containing protein [Brevundimonas sp.]|uniref:IPTL-CTERM sorting domain-containing protein n=1 Tax=Brevundimonas sp. TaxID=1871086 RepID=UPI003D12F845
MHRFSLVAGVFAAAALALAAVPAAAQNLVSNPSFESPVLTPGNVTQDTIPGGWTGQASGGFGYGVSYEAGILLTPNGTQWAFTNNQGATGSIAQQTAKTVVAGATYTLTAEVGLRTDTTAATGTSIQLWSGGTVANGVVTGGTMVASQPIVQSSGAFVSGTASWVGTAPQAGQLLTVRLLTTGASGQTGWDNVSLTEALPPVPPVPTLSEWAMILVGLMLAGTAVLLVQRRKLEA